MKALPKAVQLQFPCAPDCAPDRPWWTELPNGYYKRHDGSQPWARDAKQMAELDALNPIPHPGYRAGQVWASERGTSLLILNMGSDSAWIVNRGQEGKVVPVFTETLANLCPYLMADPACPHLAPWSPSESEKP